MTVAANAVNCKQEPGVFMPVVNRDKCVASYPEKAITLKRAAAV